MTQQQFDGGNLEEETGLDSDESEDLFTLSPSTLIALTSFFDEQDAARNSLLSLSIQSHPASSTTTETDLPLLLSSNPDCRLQETMSLSLSPSVSRSRGITVETFKAAFKENWQLSQFWYSQDTAERLTRALKGLCSVSDRVAFVCCPTGYVAFKGSGLATKELYLFEHDARFGILAETEFIPYDLDEPLSFARKEALKGSMDVVVVDPPFHSEASQMKISSTIAHLIRPGGCLVVLTGLTLSPLIDGIYPSPPLPKLHRKGFMIEHDGVGRLATPYGCWVGGGMGSDNGFGETLDDSTP